MLAMTPTVISHICGYVNIVAFSSELFFFLELLEREREWERVRERERERQRDRETETERDREREARQSTNHLMDIEEVPPL